MPNEQEPRRKVVNSYQERGIVTDVVVPIASNLAGGVAAGAAGAWAQGTLSKPKQEPPSDGKQ